MAEESKPSKPLNEVEFALVRAEREKKKYNSAVRWYAVYVQPQHEFQISDYLLGIDDKGRNLHRGKAKREDLFVKVDESKIRMQCYVPVIRLRVKYSDRYVWKEKIQTPGLIFVRTALDNRNPLFHSPISEYVTGFLSDRNLHRPMPIPDDQMELFRLAVESEYAVSVSAPTFTIGQKVLVLDGPLKGHIAELVATKETISRQEYETDIWGKQVLDHEGNPVPKHKTLLTIRLNALLVANFEIDADKVVPAPDNARDYEEQD